MDDSTATINEAVQLVEDRLASRVSIVFSHGFLEEFPSSAQAYFNEGIHRTILR
jgi:phosphoribosylpyrophosphate synthetase